MKFEFATWWLFLSLIEGLRGELCDTYIHPTYGKGKCVNMDRCPGSLYISNFCESYPNEVKCCFSSPTDGCSTYKHPVYGSGNCVKKTECQTSNQYSLSGYCDGYPIDHTCCFNKTIAPMSSLKSCGLDAAKGKGVCVSSANCPNGNIALTNECDANQVCCYSLQNDLNYYEFRGVWISTVANIDWPSSRISTTDKQKQELIDILNVLQSVGINVAVFQVRPAGDAFYQSTLEPWSYYFTGQQGKAPNPLWDPLSFIIDEAKKRNIEVHAWLNPYRGRNKGETYTLASNHMANRFSKYAYNYNGYLIMDPASTEVRQHILNVIDEIITKYNVSGIHIDDYFYPYPDGVNDFPDSASYSTYLSTGGTLAKADWRRDNVNKMVSGIYSLIKSKKPLVQFGVSPFGIWRPGNPTGIVGFDSYNSIYADSKKWLEMGWLDYMTPQLYWEIDPPAQSFKALLKWWCEQNPKNKLVAPGTALYKMENNNWSSYEIQRQIELTRSYRNISSFGAIHFTTNQIMRDVKGIKSVLKQVYSKPALAPFKKV